MPDFIIEIGWQGAHAPTRRIRKIRNVTLPEAVSEAQMLAQMTTPEPHLCLVWRFTADAPKAPRSIVADPEE